VSEKDEFKLQNQPLEKNLLRYVWFHTRREQLWVLSIILLSMPTLFLVLDLPKNIINRPIQGVGFEEATATASFLSFSIDLPTWLYSGGTIQLFDGFTLERLSYLLALSFSFLALVCVNGLFKFYINTYKGRLGERMLRRLRYELVDRVLRFPTNQFRRVKASEIASMVKDEVEPFGEFIGDAFVKPVFLGGQALIAFVFIILQNLWLGLIAVGIIIFQMIIIPILRKRVLVLGRMRQLTARQLSGRIGEIVDGITAVHVNDTSNYERAEIASRLGRIFNIRYELYQRKFFVKFINNFLAQLTPFIFYVVGGYFAIRGTLDIGQLVAVIAAYKELPSPINGLIAWDQKRVDINIKYAQIVEQFNTDEALDAQLQKPTSEVVEPLKGRVVVSNLVMVDESGSTLLDDIDMSFAFDEVISVVGPPNSGADTMVSALARLQSPSSGRILMNGRSLGDIPESITGRRISYISGEAYLPQESLENTLLYSLKHAPLVEQNLDAQGKAERARRQAESKLSGNTLQDINDDWVDYGSAGASGSKDIHEELKRVLQIVELDQMIFDLALRQTLDPAENPDLCAKMVEARTLFRNRLEKADLARYVELFDEKLYNTQATIAENLLFGTSSNDMFTNDKLASNPHIQNILEETGLDKILYEMGIELASTAIELFADLSPDNPFFEQLNFMAPDEIEDYQPVVARLSGIAYDDVKQADREMLIRLPFSYVEPRNRLGLLSDEIRQKILNARALFQQNIPDDQRKCISFYEKDSYNAMATLQDNILLGRVAYGFSDAAGKIQQEIGELLDEMQLQDDMFKVGLMFNIGTAGKRLSEVQRQKVAFARVLLKRSDLLIVNRALNAMDGRTQERIIRRVVDLARGSSDTLPFGLMWVLMAPTNAQLFDRVLVFEHGKLVEDGKPGELKEDKGAYASLLL
jgi:putative ABC transport system ATP-binding protein